MPDNLVIAGRAFKSRLIVGTGKYRSFQEMARAHAASGADMVTVAVASAVMPLAAPIGSGLGVQNPANLRILRERITEVPMIVDAGVGTASDAAVAMELGADGVLMNTAIAEAQDAVLMAEAMRDAVIAGRKSYLAGRMPKRLYASASSPLSGVVR